MHRGTHQPDGKDPDTLHSSLFCLGALGEGRSVSGRRSDDPFPLLGINKRVQRNWFLERTNTLNIHRQCFMLLYNQDVGNLAGICEWKVLDYFCHPENYWISQQVIIRAYYVYVKLFVRAGNNRSLSGSAVCVI